MELWQLLFCLGLLCFTVDDVHAKTTAPLQQQQPSCSDRERSALLQFKQSFLVDCAAAASLSLTYGKAKSWTTGANSNCCSWDGVECDVETGNVIELDLSSSCLYGNFPHNSTLFDLTHLRKLNLAFNDFNYSRVPSELGQLRNLQSLNLSSSAFSGQIPSGISALSEITVLDLSSGSYYGSLGGSQPRLKLRNPSLDRLIRNMTRLSRLQLSDVDISSTLPIFLTNLSLREISLADCNLYGEVPLSLFGLPQLEIVRFNGNSDLSGVLPQFQVNSPLKELSVYGTAFSGELPPSIGNLGRLVILNLENSQFSGSIPSSIGNLSALTGLILSYNKFTGDIPLSITNLTNLLSLALSDLNAMSAQVRLQLPKLHRLASLRLAGIVLDSEIPYFLANHTGLTFLDLSGTQLKGQFPHWFANLTQLQKLNLRENQLEGFIPQWFSQLTMLNSLQLADNNLFGKFETFNSLNNLVALDLGGVGLTFPAYLGKISSMLNLRLLDLSYCNLTEFPLFLQDLRELQVLYLEGNNMKGSIPQWLINTTQESLLMIDLSLNQLTGFEHHVSALPWTNLEGLLMYGNNLKGSLPAPPGSLQVYAMSDNELTGNIPQEICGARFLRFLDISNNSISGHLPSCMGGKLSESLQLLNMRGNNLTGILPTKFTKLCKLKMINFSENKLQGELPRSLLNCTKLQVLDVGKNNFSDTFPSQLGSLPELQVLVLRHNKFQGSIEEPRAGYMFSSLRIIDLSYNLFIGDLPSVYLQNWHKMQVSNEDDSDPSNTVFTIYIAVGPDQIVIEAASDYSITITNKGSETLYTHILTVFRVIDFSSNKFTGKIPDMIGDLKGLQALNLSNNNLYGEIPPSITNITDLESLDLSLNMLSGAIPKALSQITSLEVLNVSYNHLMGPIPQGNQFDTFENSSYYGNSRLCGSPLSNTCKNADATPSPLPPVLTQDNGNEDSELTDWIIRSCGCLSGFVIGAVIGKFYITDKYNEWFEDVFQRRPKKRVRIASRLRR